MIHLIKVEGRYSYIGEIKSIACPYLGTKSIRITECFNIRYWGTSKGFGELAIMGKQTGTKLDECPPITIPISKIISIYEVNNDVLNSFGYDKKRHKNG